MHGSQAVSRPIPLTFAHPSSLSAEQSCLAAFVLGLPVISTLSFCTSTSGSHHAKMRGARTVITCMVRSVLRVLTSPQSQLGVTLKEVKLKCMVLPQLHHIDGH